MNFVDFNDFFAQISLKKQKQNKCSTTLITVKLFEYSYFIAHQHLINYINLHILSAKMAI